MKTRKPVMWRSMRSLWRGVFTSCVDLNSPGFGGVLAAFLVFAMTSLAHACLWDWDTVQMERRRFPGTLEIMTGKFVRHSPAYYEWRIQDRTRRLRSPAEDPELADDLAVAYSKLGRHDEAIALLKETLESHADRYETLANLGTIYMLAGDLQTGKDYIDRAIGINPNAHFGRERYQSLLAEYFLTARKTPHPHSEDTYHVHPKQAVGFAAFVLKKKGLPLSLDFKPAKETLTPVEDELTAAQRGVLGMMHFANYDSPLLLEALGDLLIAWPTYQSDAMHLAARAYYRVAQQAQDPLQRQEFEQVAKNVVYGNLDYINWREKEEKKARANAELPQDLTKLAADLATESAAAQKYVAVIEADERRWIATGMDVDAAFAAKYYDSLDKTIEAAKSQLAKEPRDVRDNPYQLSVRAMTIILVVITAVGAGLVLTGVFINHRWNRRMVNPSRASESD